MVEDNDVYPDGQYQQLLTGAPDAFVDSGATAPFTADALNGLGEAFGDYNATSTDFQMAWPPPEGGETSWDQTENAIFVNSGDERHASNTGIVNDLDLNADWDVYFEALILPTTDVGRELVVQIQDTDTNFILIKLTHISNTPGFDPDQLQLVISGGPTLTSNVPSPGFDQQAIYGLHRRGDDFQVSMNGVIHIATTVPGKTFTAPDYLALRGQPDNDGTIFMWWVACSNVPQPPL